MGSVPLPAVIGALLGLALVASPAAGETPAALRAVTFNLLHGGPASGLSGDDDRLDDRLTMVARELRAVEPDIIGLQESSISRGRHVAARLARDLGLHWAHASATRRVSGIGVLDRLVVWAMNFEEGPAILSRWPIVETEVIDLPRCARFYDPRVVLRAVVETPRGRLQVFSTHLAHDACQGKRLGEIVRTYPGPLPALILGDFNASDAAPWLQAFIRETGLVDAYRTANPTSSGFTVWQRPGAPDRTVSRRVDFVFILPGTAVPGSVLASRVILSTPGRFANGATLWPSDHYGVLADIEVRGLEAHR